VSIADRIIDAGPYAAGQTLPVELVRDVFKTGELNALRAELIAGRQARGLDGATPTIHVTKAEFHTERFWDERINPVAAAHGMAAPEAEVAKCSKCGGALSACVDCGTPAQCGEPWCGRHSPDGDWGTPPTVRQALVPREGA
jgi:hypothetical protein